MPLSKSIIIEDFTLMSDGQYIYVDYSNKDDIVNSIYVVIRSVFEQWLKHNNRLDWVLDYVSGGEHQQHEGTAAIEDYWENAEYDLKLKDLKDFMLAASGDKSELV